MVIKIFIDEGHNPENPNAGAEGNGYREQDITYNVGKELEKILQKDCNFEVKLSRNSPNEILGTTTAESLAKRVNEANSFGAKIFISLHTNASDIEKASGTEAYIYKRGISAEKLALDLVKNLSEITGFANRGVYPRPSLYVLRKTIMPAVLLEMGFISNKEEAGQMANNPKLYAEGIYRGIKEYFGLNYR